MTEMTLRERVHALVDQLPEERLDEVVEILSPKTMTEDERQSFMLAWLEQAEALSQMLEQKYGQFPSAVDIINENREERLNDIMGGS